MYYNYLIIFKEISFTVFSVNSKSAITFISLNSETLRSTSTGWSTGKLPKWLGKHNNDPSTDIASARGAYQKRIEITNNTFDKASTYIN